MPYRSLSVATLVRGRQAHFDHLIAGLAAQSFPPDELVVAYMQDEPPTCPEDLPYAVTMVHVPGGQLPLAEARNRAAAQATGEILLFLDVDCIGDPDLVLRAHEAIESNPEGIFLPEVRYLPARATGWLRSSGPPDYRLLKAAAERHPAKPDLGETDISPIDDHGELWGLAFILHRDVWAAADGMCADYVGYGGEETDFAQRLRRAGYGLCWLGGTICYHQHHPVHIPPLQHFDAIVRNASLFHKTWGEWCMTYWLDAFERDGLIRRHRDAIEIVRHPTGREISTTRQGPEVRFS